MQVTRSTPLEWDAVQTLARYERQSQESFAEQREAVEWFVRQIDKYRTTHGHTGLTHTKNLIAYGAPGARLRRAEGGHAARWRRDCSAP